MERPDAAAIRHWLVTRIATLLEEPPETIDPTGSIMDFALSSMEAVTLAGELENWLDRSLSPLLIYEHPSIEGLALHLAKD